MEAQAALVGADGRVELNAVAAVDLDLAVVVHPGDTELNDTLGLDKALQQGILFPLGMLVDHQLQRLKDLADGLQELRLMSVALFHAFIHALQILVGQHDNPP